MQNTVLPVERTVIFDFSPCLYWSILLQFLMEASTDLCKSWQYYVGSGDAEWGNWTKVKHTVPSNVWFIIVVNTSIGSGNQILYPKNLKVSCIRLKCSISDVFVCISIWAYWHKFSTLNCNLHQIFVRGVWNWGSKHTKEPALAVIDQISVSFILVANSTDCSHSLLDHPHPFFELACFWSGKKMEGSILHPPQLYA